MCTHRKDDRVDNDVADVEADDQEAGLDEGSTDATGRGGEEGGGGGEEEAKE